MKLLQLPCWEDEEEKSFNDLVDDKAKSLLFIDVLVDEVNSDVDEWMLRSSADRFGNSIPCNEPALKPRSIEDVLDPRRLYFLRLSIDCNIFSLDFPPFVGESNVEVLLLLLRR